MTNAFKIGCIIAAGSVASIGQVDAAVVNHTMFGNAINYCQAFTPGPSNTIRNRVVGSENIGDTIAVACNFHAMGNGSAGNAPPTSLRMYFVNNRASGAVLVSCTMLTGFLLQGGATQYAVTRSIGILPGTRAPLEWGPEANPMAGATNLGNYFIGVNCTLRPGTVMTETYLNWSQDNGV